MKLSDLSDQEWFHRLERRRIKQQVEARAWLNRYDGNAPMYWLSKLLAEQDDRFPALTINWEQKFLDTIDGLCVTEGFLVNGTEDFDPDMWAAWTRNDMPEFESENNINTLATGHGFVAVGPSDDGALITVESPEQMAIEIDPRSRKTVASLLFYKSDPELVQDDLAVLQVAGENGMRQIEFENGKPVGESQHKWMAAATKLQSSPDVPVVRYLNRQRQRVPRSELRALAPIVDGTNLMATHMLATSHHHAMPRMLAINVSESQFFNDDGSVNRDAVKAATGSMWIVPAEEDEQGRPLPPDQVPDVDIKQLPASDLRNFLDAISLLGRIGAGLCDMSPSDFGFGIADNPESSQSQTMKYVSMATRVRRVHASRGSAHARVARLTAAVEGRDLSALKSIETRWLDPSKMTSHDRMKMAVEGYGAGLSDLHQARLDAGYSPTTITAMEKRERTLARDPFTVTDDGFEADSDAATAGE